MQSPCKKLFHVDNLPSWLECYLVSAEGDLLVSRPGLMKARHGSGRAVEGCGAAWNLSGNNLIGQISCESRAAMRVPRMFLN